MSWHLSRRLTTIHYAVSMALLYSVSSAALLSNAQAAVIGKTLITSAQHQPLVARIMVTDINPADFIVSLADSTLYQQMGLTPTHSMSVGFVATAADSGHITINTAQPVMLPFADIILTINEKGQRKIMPKTLLMPLASNNLLESENTKVGNAQLTNLPIQNLAMSQVINTQPLNTQPLMVRGGMPPALTATANKPINNNTSNAQPLLVREGTPPPLFTPASASETLQAQALLPNMLPKTILRIDNNTTLLRVNLSPISASSLGMPAAPKTSPIKVSPAVSNVAVMTASNVSNSQLSQSSIPINAGADNNNIINKQAFTARNKQAAANSLSIRTTNKSPDTFTVQVTRRIAVVNKIITPNLTPTILATNNNLPIISAQDTQLSDLNIQTMIAQNQDKKSVELEARLKILRN